MKKHFITLAVMCITGITAHAISIGMGGVGVDIPVTKIVKAAYNSRPYLTELDKEVKIASVGKREFILVGKINADTTQVNRTFLAESEGLDEEAQKHPDMYQVQCIYPKEKDQENFYRSNVSIFCEGNYFFIKYKIPTDKIVRLRKVFYTLFYSEYLKSELPVRIKFSVPEDAQAIYIGDLSYLIQGDDLDATLISTTYNLEEAQAALDKVTAQHIDLVQLPQEEKEEEVSE